MEEEFEKHIGHVAIPLYGRYGKGKVTLVDGDYDGEYFGGYKWYLNTSTGLVYRQDYDTETHTATTVMLHQEVTRAPKGMWVRHNNGNLLDNRSCNLKWVTPKFSANNRKPPTRRDKTTQIRQHS